MLQQTQILRFLLLFTLFYSNYTLVIAQTIQDPATKIERNIENVPVFIEFDTAPSRNLPSGSASEVFKRYLKTTQDDELRQVWNKSDEIGFQHTRYQQYYRGIKVEYGTYTIHTRKNIITSAGGEFYPLTINTKPTLTEAGALQAALNSVKAKVYKWQLPEEEKWLKKDKANPNATFYPKGELVICPDYTEATKPARLAYKFDVYAQQPLSREFIYIDAHSGKVIHRNLIIKNLDATGTAITKYSGSRTMTTDELTYNTRPLTYRLRGVGGRGQGIETYNMKKGAIYSNARDFFDGDNSWGREHNNANMDNAALDAHWGAQVTYDYWKNVHRRNSYDDHGSKLKGYVHTNLIGLGNPDNDNAFWDGERMIYGDGEYYFSPVTSLDVVAHEIGHAITDSTAGLVYKEESGALNEGFSDIWAACIEHYKAPEKANWLIGEDITKVSPKFLRSMSNPNAGYQPQPDTYEGKYWHSQSDPHDNYGVHTNSGVLNYWFYLLSQGGSGTNDKGKFYSVASITIEKAAKIAYRTLRDKLAPNDNYAIACTKSIEAAKELYGSRSAEAIAVNNAWYAVGVAKYLIIPPPPTPKNFTSTVFSTNQINLKWSDVLLESSYTILYTTKNPYLPTSGIVLMQSINVSANVTTFESKNLNPGTTYYYRIKASNGSGSSPYSAWIKATTFIPIVARKSNAEEQLEKTSLSKAFFPNPAKDKVTVDLSLYKGIPITIFIYDLTGRLHRSFSETANHSSQIQINVSHLIPGAYLLRVQTPTSFKSYKLIKE